MAPGRTSYKYLLVTGLSFILVSCSVEKNTETSRFYNSMTARYNIYFNGYESFKAGLVKIGNGYHDDYSEILNVFEYSDPATANMAASDMERAIQKASKVISLKSITSKPEIKNKRDITEKEKKLLDRKEYNEWVDDSYLLIGKARFYKHEYKEAGDVFRYCISDANDPLIRDEASIWLARTNIETKDYIEASRLLNELKITGESKEYLQSMYYTTFSDLYIRQKRYQESIEPLNKAVTLVSGKKTKYRLLYLLAQLYEQTGDGGKATALYRKVVKMNPPYEVEFNARINIAGVFDINTGNPAEIRKEMEKMLRDSKNKEFHDQILFALGNLSMKEGKDSEALMYFKKSAAASTRNLNQKGRSYLSLANYYYKNADYMNAGLYYDSTTLFLDQKRPEFAELKSKSQNLKELLSYLVVVEREDSLQRVALMPEAQRNYLISSIIANAGNDQQQNQMQNSSDRYNIGQYYENERRFQGNIEQEGKWYFYNQAALTFGRTEFRRRWGDRKLEDNWRRSNRTKVNTTQPVLSGGDNAVNTTDSAGAQLDRKNPGYYLKDLPMNDSLLNISNEKLSTALLNAGKAYSERIYDTVKAADTFESLLKRFPSSPLVPETLYNLYKITKGGRNNKSETYRQRLIEKYPDSEFAHILSDPSYFRNKTASMEVTEKLYEEAYDYYKNEKFQAAISVTDSALAKYPDNTLAPKFMLLHSYSIARVSDEINFKEDLGRIVKSWPGTPESNKATELITYLNQKMPELKIAEDIKIATELYVIDTISSRTFALVIADPKFSTNQAAFDVISYNIDKYTNNNYKTEATLIDNKFILITVTGFTNYNQALAYFYSFNDSKPVRNQMGVKMMKFVINRDNLRTLLEDKNPERYEIFFRENYLKSLSVPASGTQIIKQ